MSTTTIEQASFAESSAHAAICCLAAPKIEPIG
jgi:hypothetical protein